MRGAKSDFEVFADNEETSKSTKRIVRSRKEAPKPKSPPTETTRSGLKGTAQPQKTPTETVPKPALKMLGNNNKENIDPRLGKPAGKKKNESTPKTNSSLQSPPNKVSNALNNKNRNILQGKTLKQVRINDKPAKCNTPKSKETSKASTIPFSPLADITEAYNSKCPTPLPLSVSFSGTSTERRLEQVSVTDQIAETAVSESLTKPSNPLSEEGKTMELGKINMHDEDISLNTVLKVEGASHPDNHRSRCDITDMNERAAKMDASEKITVNKSEVDRSSPPSTLMKPILSNSSIDANQPLEILNTAVGLEQKAPIQDNRTTEGKTPKPKKLSSAMKSPVNKLKRKAPGAVDAKYECPNKRQRDENYTTCTDLLKIKLGADRSATATIEDVPEKKRFFKRIIMEFVPEF